MAYTNAPIVSTYSTHRSMVAHDGYLVRLNQPMFMYNLLPTKEKDVTTSIKVAARSRPNLTEQATITSNGVCRGLYIWEKVAGTVYYFLVVGTSVYTSTSATGPFTAVTTLLTNATTPVRFTEYIDNVNTKSLIMVDGVEGYIFTSNAAGTKITDPDFPTPHIPFPVFLDGYLFLAKSNTGDIYNSDLNNPAAWTAGSFISTEVYPDDTQALVKINNYILAIGTTGCEYFYDAANATGTPLARYEGVNLPVGTVMPNSVAYLQDMVFFLSRDFAGEFVLVQVQDTKYHMLPNEAFATQLPQALATSSAAALRGYFFRSLNSIYYGLQVDGVSPVSTVWTTPATPATHFVYSLDAGMWSVFTIGDKDSATFLAGGGTYDSTAHRTYPIFFSATGTTTSNTTYVAGNTQGNTVLCTLGTGNVGSDTMTINGTSRTVWYPQVCSPDAVDFDSRNLKFMSRFSLDYTNYLEATSATPTVFYPRISWTEGIASGSTTGPVVEYPIEITTLAANKSIPYASITQLGAFRRRWFNIFLYGSIIIKAMEFDINKGQQ